MRFRLVSTIVFCVLAGACAVCVADEAPKAKGNQVSRAPATPDPIVEIFSFKNMRAQNALAIVRDVFRDLSSSKGSNSAAPLRFAVDEQLNRLIASGDRQTLTSVEDLLQKLDKHENVAKTNISVTFDLRYIDPHEAELGVRELGIEGVRTLVNRRTKGLIVNGPKVAIDRVHNLVVSLDVPPSEPHGEDVAIRVVWLVDKSLATENTPAVPPDLDSAIAALRTKMEIGELRMATQIMVNVSGTAALVRKADLQLTGVITGAKSNRMDLQFSATEGQGGKPVCRLNTAIGALLPGRPIIVGMTTMDSRPSLIVIELLPK
jgi:type II secretory pathway component GspD/PulD (secretin)